MSEKKSGMQVLQSQDLPKKMWLKLDVVRQTTKGASEVNGINCGKLQNICDRCFGPNVARAEVTVIKETHSRLAICRAHCRGVMEETFVVSMDWLIPIMPPLKPAVQKTSPSVRDFQSYSHAV